MEVPILVQMKMCVLYANHYGLSEADEYAKLSDGLKEMFLGMEYCDICAPLIYNDRNVRGHSWAKISNRYLLPQTTVVRIEARFVKNRSENGRVTTLNGGK